MNKIQVTDPKKMIKLCEFFVEMSEFQQKYDHPVMALNCYVTAKTLLYWAKVGMEENKS